LAESARAETDIRRIQLFTELLYIASGRRGDAVFAKEVFDYLIQKGCFTEDDLKDLDALRVKITQTSMLVQTPGSASANAAFASIATLAKRHPVLRDSSIEALESFRSWMPELSEKYLRSIQLEEG
jgi:hypothetical protein